MSRDEINELLWAVPADERLAMLICSVVERDPGAVRPIAGLIAFAVRMANMLPIESRVVLAERMRDAADEIEQRRQKVPIECGPLFSSSSCSGSHAAGLKTVGGF